MTEGEMTGLASMTGRLRDVTTGTGTTGTEVGGTTIVAPEAPQGGVMIGMLGMRGVMRGMPGTLADTRK